MNKQVEDVMLLPARILLVVLTWLYPMMPKGHPCQTVTLRGWLEQRSPDAFITGLTMWVVVAIVVIISLLIRL